MNCTTAPKPEANHFMPKGAGLGASVKLLPPPPQGKGEGEMQFERPSGRLLLYWGCGAKAGPGQPVIIDFAKVAAGQVPPNLFSTAVPVVREVTPENSKSYVEWPNSKSNKMPSKDSSLLGAHRVHHLLGQAQAQEFRNGFFDQTAQVWNQAGVMLATSHQVVYFKE